MDKKQFNEALSKIFKEDAQLGQSLDIDTTGAKLVDPGVNSLDAFKNEINKRLRGLKKSPVGTPHTEVPVGKPGEAHILDERENPISVGTIKNQVQNYGPKGLSQIIAKMNADMDKTDSNGQPTSEYNLFVDSIKQSGLELVLKVSASAGGVKIAPGGTPATATPAEDPNKKEPGQELASL